MPVGYGYDKNTQPLFIDWSEISKSFTDEIKARKEKGEAEKQSILNNRQEFDKLLVDRPSGQNEVANAVITSAVDQIKEYSLANFNRYKDKQTTLGQYKNFENNLNSSTNLLFDAVGNFNKNFDEFATRAQNGTASQIEVFMHEMMQNYTDFGRIAVNVDPRTGSIIIAQLDENGEVTDKTVDVSQLGYFSKYKRDTYNINGEVAKVADALGTKFIQDSSGKSLKYQGMMYDELVNNDELMKGLDAEVNSLIDQGFELESVLADNMGYKIVTEKSDNPNELYFNQDSNEFEISDTQKQAAFQHVRDKLARAITVERKEPQAEEPESLDPQRVYEQYLSTLRLINQSGKQIPKDLIDLALASIPGVDPKQFEDLTFEDAPVKETASERKARLKRERDNVIVKKSNTWYENEFLTDIQEGERYTNDDLRQLLLNTPYVIDENGKVTFGSSEVYNFNTNGKVDFEDVVEFKKKLKAVLDPNQEVFLYYTANPDQMTGGSDGIDDYSNY